MVGGQVLDLAAEGRIAGPESTDLEAIHQRKTGALFRSAVRLGVYAAGVTDGELLAAADDYAAAFGLAFQGTDDLHDVAGSTDAAGTRVGKDAARGKLTYPGRYGVEASRMKAVELGREAVAAAGRFGPGGEPLAEAPAPAEAAGPLSKHTHWAAVAVEQVPEPARGSSPAGSPGRP